MLLGAVMVSLGPLMEWLKWCQRGCLVLCLSADCDPGRGQLEQSLPQKQKKKANTSSYTLRVPTWYAAIDTAWPSLSTWPDRWPDPWSAAADMSAIYEAGKWSISITILIDLFCLQPADFKHMYTPQEVLAQHMFGTECVRSVCAVHQHSCLVVRAHLFQVISSLLA